MRVGFCACAQDDGARLNFARRPRDSVDVKNAARAIAVRIHQNFEGHGVRNQSTIPGLECVGDGGKSGIEVRLGDAAAFARAAIVTWAAAIQ